METSLFFKTLTLVLVVLTLSWAWRILNWVWLKPRKLERCLRAQGFTGNPYHFLFGDMIELHKWIAQVKSRPINLSDDIVPRLVPFHQRIETHGKQLFLWLGPKPCVSITNPEQLKEVFTKTGDFLKPIAPVVKLLALGLTAYEGEKWAMHRKIINPAFHTEKLKLMMPAFYTSCNEMITKWDKLLASTAESCEIDVWPDLQNLTSDAISRTAFGSSYEEGRKIFELQREQAEHVRKNLQSPFYRIPGSSFLPTKLMRRMRSTSKEIESVLQEIISKRIEAMKAREAANDDLLGLLLESNMKEIREHKGDKNIGMTINDVMDECKLFYFAGQETTSVLLVWTLILLSIHPQWQARAREEVLQAFGTSKPDFDGLNRLKIVTMILYEVLRLYPPVPSLARMLPKETKLGNLTLPAAVDLSLPTILIHHDKEFWGDDAKEFKPERFAEGVSKATKYPVTFFPFGWGPRICIGQAFAMVEAKLAMAMILQRYLFGLSPSYAHAPTTILTLHPQYGAPLFLRKY